MVKKQFTKEFLISELHRAAYNKGRTPIKTDMKVADGYPSFEVYIDEFETWNNALIAAGLTPNNIIHKYNGNECCSICGKTKTIQWCYDENDLICHECYTEIWRMLHPDKIRSIAHKSCYKRKGYGSIPINDIYDYYHGHHLWLENRSDFVIFFPGFLHKLHYHDHNNEQSMITVNALALDYWINENLYNLLYLTNR